MMWLAAILLPPLAVLLCGKPIQALLNILLTLCFWLPGMIHALFVVGSSQADRRAKEIVKSNQATAAAIERQTAAQLAATQAQLRRDAIK
jgi:uncharacterized membrane protein YqaE (UPF0057 family)